MEESLELRIMDELSKARDQAGELAEQYLMTQTDNAGVIMTKTGARGSMLNIAQMVASVGQQSIRWSANQAWLPGPGALLLREG